MLRLVGIDLPENKRIVIALTYVYGIGPKIAKKILEKAKISEDLRAKDLTAVDVAKLQKIIEEFKVNFQNQKAQFIRLKAKNTGVCPPWHDGAGGKAWLFVDEVVVE